jgi:DNA-3-methyladenine glycosylase
VRLPRDFYDRATLTVAAELLGKVLVHDHGRARTSGVIVEVEAYVGESDPACHAAPGPTPRNRPLYGPPGIAYVYLNYGIHHLVNVVTEAPGSPAAVLVRALEPADGIPLMRRRRLEAAKGVRRRAETAMADAHLCRGPGNVTRAMGITLAQNQADLVGGSLFIEDRGIGIGPVVWGPRIGITVGVDRPWRAYVTGHASVSGMQSPRPRGGRSGEPDALPRGHGVEGRGTGKG